MPREPLGQEQVPRSPVDFRHGGVPERVEGVSLSNPALTRQVRKANWTRRGEMRRRLMSWFHRETTGLLRADCDCGEELVGLAHRIDPEATRQCTCSRRPELIGLAAN